MNETVYVTPNETKTKITQIQALCLTGGDVGVHEPAERPLAVTQHPGDTSSFVMWPL